MPTCKTRARNIKKNQTMKSPTAVLAQCTVARRSLAELSWEAVAQGSKLLENAERASPKGLRVTNEIMDSWSTVRAYAGGRKGRATYLKASMYRGGRGPRDGERQPKQPAPEEGLRTEPRRRGWHRSDFRNFVNFCQTFCDFCCRSCKFCKLMFNSGSKFVIFFYRFSWKLFCRIFANLHIFNENDAKMRLSSRKMYC